MRKRIVLAVTKGAWASRLRAAAGQPHAGLRIGVLLLAVCAAGGLAPLPPALAVPAARPTLERRATPVAAATATPSGGATATPAAGATARPTATPSTTSEADDGPGKTSLAEFATVSPDTVMTPVALPLDVSDITAQRRAKARPDECFIRTGGIVPPGPPCNSSRSQPKVNFDYLWGIAKAGPLVWFGTGANIHCLVGGVYIGTSTSRSNSDSVCERGRSQIARLGLVPPQLGDFRPPQIFTFHTGTNDLIERSPVNDNRFRLTVGIRSAGVLGDLAMLAGPALRTDGGINVFAFNANTGQYIGSDYAEEYDNIRKWVVAGNVLYTGVLDKGGGGSIIRMKGDLVNPFQIDVVGHVDNEVADITIHDGRLFVSTWPILTETQGRCPKDDCPPAGIWMSPPIGTGLTPAQANQWQKVWDVTEYEPDPAIASAYGLGALRSFGGYLYWGTMHFPGLATQAHDHLYGGSNRREEALTRRNSLRSISIFRGQNLSTTPTFQLLYGETQLMAFDKDDGWRLTPTGMGAPLYGKSGFNTPLNIYTWTMEVFNGHLYVGTLDQSDSVEKKGADLWRFTSTTAPAVAVSTGGIGNNLSYGVRSMMVDDRLYLGMANPANLRTDPPDAPPAGGWELISISTAP